MSSPASTTFLSPPPRIIPRTPPSLSATPSTNPQSVSRLVFASLDSTRDVSQSRNPIGQQRAPSIDFDPNGEQSRITMQTRVAVRAATPHRFQIIPLREHRLSNLPETHNGDSNERRYRSYELMLPVAFQQTSISEPLSCVSRMDENNKLPPEVSAQSFCVPRTTTSKHESVVSPAPDTRTSTSVQVEKRATTPPSKTLLHQIKPENIMHAELSLHEQGSSPSVPAGLRLSSEYPDLQKPGHRNVKSNIVLQGTINGSCVDVASEKIKCRVCSEDLTCCGDPKRTHGHLCLRCPCGDSSWHTTVTVTRRHAIYTDALPIISRGSSVGQLWRAPVAHNHEADQLSNNHYVGPRYSQAAPNRTLEKGLRIAPGMVYNSVSGNIVPSTESWYRINPPAAPSVPAVPHLRLFKKTRNLSASRATSTRTREVFAKHSNTVLELIAQLDQAIRDWKELGRDHAVLCTTLQGSRL